MQNKLTRIFTIAALLIGLFISSSYGQAFTIESFDGNKQLVKVLFDDSKGILTVECANSAIHINDINHVDTIHLINKNFLLVAYHFRAGSGIEAAKTLLLSTRNRRLYESLHINSLFKEEFMDFRKPTSPMKTSVKTIHKVAISLTGSSVDNYKIRAKIHDERKSIDEPKSNYNNDIVSNLSFDRSTNIFYSSQEEIAPYFIKAYAKIEHNDKEIIKGIFPVANLGKEKYYYQAGKWYDIPEPPE